MSKQKSMYRQTLRTALIISFKISAAGSSSVSTSRATTAGYLAFEQAELKPYKGSCQLKK